MTLNIKHFLYTIAWIVLSYKMWCFGNIKSRFHCILNVDNKVFRTCLMTKGIKHCQMNGTKMCCPLNFIYFYKTVDYELKWVAQPL